MTADSPVAGTQCEAPRVATASTGFGWRLGVLRICLVPLFVLLCYQFEWRAWRSLVVGAFLEIAAWLGVPCVRLGFDSFTCNGSFYQMVIACTALDAFFGSIPLLWNQRRPIYRTLAFLAAYFCCLSVVNLARLELGFVLYVRGVSWSVAHEAMAGVFYFGLFLWIARQRRWTRFFSDQAWLG